MIGFRVDANEYAATGHLMRCIAIATQLIKRGQPCLFFLAERKEIKRLEDRNIPYVILDSKWDDLDSELDDFCGKLLGLDLELLIVDSYQVTKKYVDTIEYILPVLLIDDLGKDLYEVSAILHYSQWPGVNTFEQKYQNTGTRILEGMKYTPLREEFSNKSKEKSDIREKSILITTGGTDTYNVAGRLIESLAKNDRFTGYSLNVVIGNMNENEEAIRTFASNNTSIRVLKNINNMEHYMRTSELAVSAGGTTLYELCACGIPTVCFSFADNQVEFTEAMSKREIMLYAGDARLDKAIDETIANKLFEYIDNQDITRKYCENMSKLVDGKGAERIAEFCIERFVRSMYFSN